MSWCCGYEVGEDNRTRNELLPQRRGLAGSGNYGDLAEGHWRNGRMSSERGSEWKDKKTVNELYEYTTCYWLKAFLVNCIFPKIALWIAPLNENYSDFSFWRRDVRHRHYRKGKNKDILSKKERKKGHLRLQSHAKAKYNTVKMRRASALELHTLALCPERVHVAEVSSRVTQSCAGVCTEPTFTLMCAPGGVSPDVTFVRALYLLYQCFPTDKRRVWNKGDRNPQWWKWRNSFLIFKNYWLLYDVQSCCVYMF